MPKSANSATVTGNSSARNAYQGHTAPSGRYTREMNMLEFDEVLATTGCIADSLVVQVRNSIACPGIVCETTAC